jgi:hypothetical protein
MPYRGSLPDVVILGAMRGGTTFLRRALAAHPNVRVSRSPEPQFYSLRWHEGESFYRREWPTLAPRWLYRSVGGERPLAVDCTPYYLFHPEAPKRAASLLPPTAKFIALLREPGERAWSHYRFTLMRGIEHLGFLDALAAEDSRLEGEESRIAAGHEREQTPHQNFSYVARGRYAEQILRWWRYFPRERFLLLNSAELFANPHSEFDRVCAFLDLPAARLPTDLPRNAAPPAAMPDQARSLLTEAFAESNRTLADLTGIRFEGVVRPPPNN